MSLKNALLGWFLIAGMVLYAVALTVVHAGSTVADALGSLGSGNAPPASNP